VAKVEVVAFADTTEFAAGAAHWSMVFVVVAAVVDVDFEIAFWIVVAVDVVVVVAAVAVVFAVAVVVAEVEHAS
jgi:hypothetical protein